MKPTLRALVAATVAAAVLAICILGHLGALGLVGPDEPRYAGIARDMAVNGDWVTPRLYGKPWFEKPILYYWTAAVGFRFLRSPEWGARLPSACAALLAALGVAYLALQFYGRETAWAVLLILPTTVAFNAFSRAATPDMLFAASLTLAMASAARKLQHNGALDRPPATSDLNPSPGRLAFVGFGVWLGLATLAKGPAALALASGSLLVWGAATRHWRALLRLGHPLAVASFSIVALPWYALCAGRNPNFLRTFLLQHNFERYVTDVFHHRQPIWFFGPIILLSFFPWTVLLAGVARDGLRLWREKSWKQSPGFFFACWAAFPVVFFSFSQSKLPSYILPAVPPLALLLGACAVRSMAERDWLGRWIHLGVGVTWVSLLALPVARFVNFLPPYVAKVATRSIYNCLEAAALTGIVIVLLALRHQFSMALMVSALLCAVMVEAGQRIVPLLDPYISARATGRAWETMPETRDALNFYHLQRGWEYGLNFYFSREVPEWTPENRNRAYVITNPRGIQMLREAGRSVRVPEASGFSKEAWEVVVEPTPR